MDSQETDLLEDLLRGRSPSDKGQAANGYFPSDTEIAKSEVLRCNVEENLEAKFFTGVTNGKIQFGSPLPDGRLNRWVEGGTPIGIPDDRHVVTIAGSRAGKGRSALTPNLLIYPKDGSILVIDPKGELARLTAEYRAYKLQQSVAILDPFDVVTGGAGKRFRAAFNPLRLLTDGLEDLLVPNANLIAEALVVPGNAKDPHWDECARNMIAGLCLHVATYCAYEGQRDLVTVWKLANELMAIDPIDEEKYRIESEMEQNPAADGAVIAEARAFYDRSGSELTSILSTLRKNLKWISYPQMKKSLRGNSIDLRDLKRKSIAVYLSLPAMRMHDLSGWLRLFVQLSLAACEEVQEAPRKPILFMLDEFHILGRLQCLETAIAQMAGFGVKLWIVLQDIGQLKKYENWETFLANAGIIQAFGNSDMATLEYLSKRLGSTQVLNPSVSDTSYEQAARTGASGKSFSIGTHPLMTPEEISRFFGREDRLLRQLVLRPGLPPLILQRVFYDKHKLFHGKTIG